MDESQRCCMEGESEHCLGVAHCQVTVTMNSAEASSISDWVCPVCLLMVRAEAAKYGDRVEVVCD